ncbi:hypothetical protein Y032_0228g2893 [Ancylostoma ceylanicum]|uniref:Fucosyltransferase n=1 Tax=Ancylostoma ceylanicum TaxID=53326 RepID=A0A016SH97_9BILA|nr:hypothetical protein Y032_0228g2893 [Ancylostoma ceylanicum]
MARVEVSFELLFGCYSVAVGSERVWPLWVHRSLVKEKEDEENSALGVEFAPMGAPPFFVEEVMTSSPIKLMERLKCRARINEPPKLILSWNAGHSQANLGGCPDWNCRLTHDKTKLARADAILFAHVDTTLNRTVNQYFVHFSQESPVNSKAPVPYADFFNMSLGYRHDTTFSSPYGYTVKLARRSHRTGEIVDKKRLEGKIKGAAWFVSHCDTNSKRESYVKQLQEHFHVDVYGSCGKLKCQRGGACENMLDEQYHFYIAFENSVCKDYITEKLWNQGYRRDIVPIVMKRAIVEQLVPPKSFIAADDFNTTKELATYLHYLMRNKSAYAEFFEWRREYKVVFLDGAHHDTLERPWGFCQICRLLWEEPRPVLSISDFNKWWDSSCEKDGELTNRLLGDEMVS